MDRADAFSDEDAAAQSAVDAAQYSYSPITNGCNVENAIYEAAHAESTALTAGVCRGYRHLVAMFVACPDLPVDSSLELSAPCGFCRQWMTEFVAPGDDVHVFLVAGDRRVRARLNLLRDLLPLAFRLNSR
jgi:cytidine deaminase